MCDPTKPAPVPAAYVYSRDLSGAAEALACLVADLTEIQSANSTAPDAISARWTAHVPPPSRSRAPSRI